MSEQTQRHPMRGPHGGPTGMAGEKAKNFKGTIGKLLRYIGNYKFAVLLVCVFAAYLGASLQAQILLFVGVSILTAAVVRPLAKKYADPHKVPTNADRLVGMEGRVTETINNDYPTGAVYIDGKTWTARSVDGAVIPKGEMVEIERMEGIKLIVRVKATVPAA